MVAGKKEKFCPVTVNICVIVSLELVGVSICILDLGVGGRLFLYIKKLPARTIKAIIKIMVIVFCIDYQYIFFLIIRKSEIMHNLAWVRKIWLNLSTVNRSLKFK